MRVSKLTRTASLLALTAALIRMFCGSAAAPQHITGALPDGATSVIDVPANWNHALMFDSHGYVPSFYNIFRSTGIWSIQPQSSCRTSTLQFLRIYDAFTL